MTDLGCVVVGRPPQVAEGLPPFLAHPLHQVLPHMGRQAEARPSAMRAPRQAQLPASSLGISLELSTAQAAAAASSPSLPDSPPAARQNAERGVKRVHWGAPTPMQPAPAHSPPRQALPLALSTESSPSSLSTATGGAQPATLPPEEEDADFKQASACALQVAAALTAACLPDGDFLAGEIRRLPAESRHTGPVLKLVQDMLQQRHLEQGLQLLIDQQRASLAAAGAAAPVAQALPAGTGPAGVFAVAQAAPLAAPMAAPVAAPGGPPGGSAATPAAAEVTPAAPTSMAPAQPALQALAVPPWGMAPSERAASPLPRPRRLPQRPRGGPAGRVANPPRGSAGGPTGSAALMPPPPPRAGPQAQAGLPAAGAGGAGTWGQRAKRGKPPGAPARRGLQAAAAEDGDQPLLRLLSQDRPSPLKCLPPALRRDVAVRLLQLHPRLTLRSLLELASMPFAAPLGQLSQRRHTDPIPGAAQDGPAGTEMDSYASGPARLGTVHEHTAAPPPPDARKGARPALPDDRLERVEPVLFVDPTDAAAWNPFANPAGPLPEGLAARGGDTETQAAEALMALLNSNSPPKGGQPVGHRSSARFGPGSTADGAAAQMGALQLSDGSQAQEGPSKRARTSRVRGAMGPPPARPRPGLRNSPPGHAEAPPVAARRPPPQGATAGGSAPQLLQTPQLSHPQRPRS